MLLTLLKSVAAGATITRTATASGTGSQTCETVRVRGRTGSAAGSGAGSADGFKFSYRTATGSSEGAGSQTVVGNKIVFRTVSASATGSSSADCLGVRSRTASSSAAGTHAISTVVERFSAGSAAGVGSSSSSSFTTRFRSCSASGSGSQSCSSLVIRKRSLSAAGVGSSSAVRFVRGATYWGTRGKAFSPRDLSPVLWLDASDTSTIIALSGKVSQWNDKSGNGRHVSQATAAQQPSTGTRTHNGLNVIDFDGNDTLTRTTVTINQPFSIASVVKFDTVATARVSMSLIDYALYGLYHDTNWRIFSGSVLGSVASADTNTHYATTIFSSAASQSQIRIDGTVVAGPGTSGNNNGSRINIGSADYAGTIGIDGFIAEVIIVSGVLSGTNLTNLETYLKGRWGL